jgi:hypothetical protein
MEKERERTTMRPAKVMIWIWSRVAKDEMHIYDLGVHVGNIRRTG